MCLHPPCSAPKVPTVPFQTPSASPLSRFHAAQPSRQRVPLLACPAVSEKCSTVRTRDPHARRIDSHKRRSRGETKVSELFSRETKETKVSELFSKQRCQNYFHELLELPSFRGRPRGRIVRSRSSFLAKRLTHASLPYGRPVAVERRIEASAASSSGRWTISLHWR